MSLLNKIFIMHSDIDTPYYIVYEDRIRRNMEILSHVAKEGGVKIIMAFKANIGFMAAPTPVVSILCRLLTAVLP